MADSSLRIQDQVPISWLYDPVFIAPWPKAILIELASWTNGMAFRNIDFSSSGRPVIKIAEIKDGVTGQTKFTNATYESCYVVSAGDMLFSWSGQPETSLDVYWWRGPDGWLNQHVFKVQARHDIDQSFLYYLRRYLKPNFIGIARNKQTTGLGHVTRKDLEGIRVAVPPLPEQRAIAHILGTLDDKIELNRQMNQTLEAMTQALFKSWFMDFNPFRGQGMQDSPLGEIPRGWAVGTLGQICDIVMGQSPPGETYNESGEGAPFYQGIRDFGFRFPTQRVYCTMPTRFAERDDVLLSVRAPVGSLNMANERCAIGRGLAALHSKEGYQSYLYYLLSHTKSRWETFNSEGTVFGCITGRNIADFQIILSPKTVVDKFEPLVASLDRLIASNEEESYTLATIRDTLLPKLLSGEIRLKDAEKFVERVI